MWANDIKIYLRERISDVVDWIGPAQDMDE
jgi:hypothetical protein